MDPLGEHDPKRVGPYRLLGRLGAGGMGQVFLGRDRRGELAAVKVVHPGFAHDEQFRLRFRREVEVSRRVTGPWVAAVVDADPDARVPWLATQYVRGPSLSGAVEAHGPLPPGTAHVIAHGLAIGLAAVHAAGLVHRDLKPSNVLLGSDHPRLIDFGISRAVDGTRMTSTGMVVGTPAYMSPEQIAGADVGPASDVFSLGSVLSYAATGSSPFGDHPPVVLMMRISGHEPDLDGVPDVLRAPVAACLAKRPEDRPTAAELAGMLGTLVARGPGRPQADVVGPTVLDTRVATEPQAPAGATRLSRRAWLAIAGVVGLTAAGGVGLAAAVSPGVSPSAPGSRWTARVPPLSEVAAAAADDRTLYVYRPSYEGEGAVVAMDSATGAERWSVPGWGQPRYTSLDVFVVPVGEVLVIGTGTVIAALDTATGQRRWEVPRATELLVPASIAVADGVTVAKGIDGLVAVDIGTGRRLWDVGLGEFAEYADVVAQNGMCFSKTHDGIDARDLRTGRRLWTYEARTDVFVAAGDTVVAKQYEDVVGLDAATGRVRWSASNPGSLTTWSSLDIVGNLLAAYGTNKARVGELLVFDPADGVVRWSKSEQDWDDLTRVFGADGIVYTSPSWNSPKDGLVRAYDVAAGVQSWASASSSRGVATLIAARGRDAYVHDSSADQIRAYTIA
jgi:eukaryotic-like serine/threonine-protein kinase